MIKALDSVTGRRTTRHNNVGGRALLCFLGNVEKRIEGTEEIQVCHHFKQCGTNKKHSFTWLCLKKMKIQAKMGQPPDTFVRDYEAQEKEDSVLC